MRHILTEHNPCNGLTVAKFIGYRQDRTCKAAACVVFIKNHKATCNGLQPLTQKLTIHHLPADANRVTANIPASGLTRV